jgi:hypothetical protein
MDRMNNSPFSMGWLMAMFDLPVMTDKERKMPSCGMEASGIALRPGGLRSDPK